MLKRFSKEIAALNLPAAQAPSAPVTEADLRPLPAQVQRALRARKVEGRPRDEGFRGHFRGRFRRSAAEGWHAVEAMQLNCRAGHTRIFHMRMRLFGLPVYIRDVYLRGRGEMSARMFDLFPVAEGRGEPLDVGELVTWLNDAVLLAPSLLLDPSVTFAPRTGDSFEVAVTDSGRTVRAVVELDADGLPRDFHTTDRFVQDARGAWTRARWSTPVLGWREREGRLLPSSGRAVWHLLEGDLCYAEFAFHPEDVVFNP
ncbi:MAG: hypothetical protein JST92_12585 [Deltaproteobacteria bacterium]|nr:hypothetical protein [Deltaproteobacteria bacterium]